MGKLFDREIQVLRFFQGWMVERGIIKSSADLNSVGDDGGGLVQSLDSTSEIHHWSVFEKCLEYTQLLANHDDAGLEGFRNRIGSIDIHNQVLDLSMLILWVFTDEGRVDFDHDELGELELDDCVALMDHLEFLTREFQNI